MTHHTYILQDRTPVPVDSDTYIKWLSKSGGHPRVGYDQIGDVTISTVFLGLDHGLWRDGPPILFETMVFGGPLDGEQVRYCTWGEAEVGHATMVEQVRANFRPA